MSDTISITIITDEGDEFVHRVEGDRWAKEENGTLYVYKNVEGGDDETVAEVGPGFDEYVVSKENVSIGDN